MLIEIHMLQNHAPSNLNRDDSGSPKDCIFGGVRRSRISSQCIKRSIRKSELFTQNVDIKDRLGVRTRLFPQLVLDSLAKDPGTIPTELFEQIGRAMTQITQKSKKDQDDENEENNEELEEANSTIPDLISTPQTVFLTKGEARAIVDQLKLAYEEDKKSFELLICYLDPSAKLDKAQAKIVKSKLSWLIKKLSKAYNPKTVDVALFGRMTTSDAFRDIEASMQVAHALSTNKMDHEFDYFTAVDDLTEDQEITGAAMIGDVEFNSACYYKYFSLDYKGLVDNLAGPAPGEKASKNDREAYEASRREACRVAALTIPAFIEAAVFTTPSGKQNSFAAHQLPDAVLVEIRPRLTPVSYANAFIKPAQVHGSVDLIEDSIAKFTGYTETLTRKFSLEASARLWFCTRETALNGATNCDSLKEMITMVRQAVEAGDGIHE